MGKLQQRATILGKNVTTAMIYLESLHAAYSKISEICPNAIYLSAQATTDELREEASKYIQRLLI